MYTQQVLKHFQNPHNQGKLRNPTAVGKAGNPICGDTTQIYLKVKNQPRVIQGGKKSKTDSKKERRIVSDIKFETLGCAAAIASASVLTDMVKGKTLEKALQISKNDVVKKLGGLPEHKVHCSLLAVDALRDAIEKLRK